MGILTGSVKADYHINQGTEGGGEASFTPLNDYARVRTEKGEQSTGFLDSLEKRAARQDGMDFEMDQMWETAKVKMFNGENTFVVEKTITPGDNDAYVGGDLSDDQYREYVYAVDNKKDFFAVLMDHLNLFEWIPENDYGYGMRIADGKILDRSVIVFHLDDKALFT